MKVATAAQMRAIDRRAIKDYGIPGIVLMENAALQVIAAVERTYADLPRRQVVVVAGRGNNGGDGFAIARHLYNLGVAVRLVVLTDPDRIEGDARRNFDVAAALGVPLTVYAEGSSLDGLGHELRSADLIIDALLGTGVSSAVRDFQACAIRRMNDAPAPVVAVDLPSGLQADSGAILGEHVRAQLTVTFALPKLGLALYPGAAAVGELVVANISIPAAAVEAEEIDIDLLEESDVRGLMPARSPDSHKGAYGHVLVVAGSRGMAGAAMMCSLAALRGGAGLVTLAWPEELQSRADLGLMEIMTLPLPQNDTGSLQPRAVDQILAFGRDRSINALVLGPGLTTHADSRTLCVELLKEIDYACVLDADGLTVLADEPSAISNAAAPLVLTPHPGEMARLLGRTTAEVQDDRLAAAREARQRFEQTVILKGAHSIIAAPGRPITINSTGNPGMATAGMGDLLAGLLGAFLAQGIDPGQAARLAAFLHGKAGDIAAQRVGQTSLIARDALEALPEALRAMGC